jgi:hypothetical protein
MLSCDSGGPLQGLGAEASCIPTLPPAAPNAQPAGAPDARDLIRQIRSAKVRTAVGVRALVCQRAHATRRWAHARVTANAS